MNTVRRRLLIALAAAFAAAATRAEAQVAGRSYLVVELIDGQPPENWKPVVPPIEVDVMARNGFVIGRNLRHEQVWLGSSTDEVVAGIRKAIAMKPDVIQARRAPIIQLIHRETKSIPVVFANTSEAIVDGVVVQSLRRPGGNVTGVLIQRREIRDKKLQAARELLPRAKRVAVVANIAELERDVPGYFEDVQRAASRLGFEAVRADLRSRSDFRAALADAKAAGARVAITDFGVNAGPDLFETARSNRIALITQIQKASVVSVGSDYDDHLRRASEMCARVLKGAKPSEMPIDVDFRLQVTVNLAVARELGIKVPEAILARADRIFDER